MTRGRRGENSENTMYIIYIHRYLKNIEKLRNYIMKIIIIPIAGFLKAV